jgi:hypothetical protein
MIKTPSGHTSIYICRFLLDNWNDFTNYRTRIGSPSFNGHANRVLVDDYTKNNVLTMDERIREFSVKKRIDMYEDSETMKKQKLHSYTDGDTLDLLNTINDVRKTVLSEIKRRGMKV